MKKIIAALVAALIFLIPVSADTESVDTTTAPVSETVTVDESTDKEMSTDKDVSAEKRLGGVLLVSSVCGAMVIAALIWRGRDRTKYL